MERKLTKNDKKMFFWGGGVGTRRNTKKLRTQYGGGKIMGVCIKDPFTKSKMSSVSPKQDLLYI